MGQQVESLESGWVGEVSIVGMRRQGDVRIGCISECEVRHEIIETTIVGLPDEGNLLEKLFARLRGVVRDLCDEAEAELSLYNTSALSGAQVPSVAVWVT